MEMKERRNPKAKHDEYTSELIPHGQLYGAIWECKQIDTLSHYNIALHDSSIQTDMFWGKQSGKCAEIAVPTGGPAAGGEPNLVLLSFSS